MKNEEMKTAAQHNTPLVGSTDPNTSLQAPTLDALKNRRESKESLERRVTELTAERDAHKSLIRGLIDQIEELKTAAATKTAANSQGAVDISTNLKETAPMSPREMMVFTGAILLPGGIRIVIRHIESYAMGGDCGITFNMANGVPIHWSARSQYLQTDRIKEQNKVLVELDKLFAVVT